MSDSSPFDGWPDPFHALTGAPVGGAKLVNRKRPFRTQQQRKDRHVDRLVAALNQMGANLGVSRVELASALYDQGIRVKFDEPNQTDDGPA